MAGITMMLHNLRQKSNEEKWGIGTTATLVDQWEARGIRLVRLVYSDGIVKFAAFVRRVGPVLDSAPGSTYRSAQYWAFCVGDAAPFADV